MTPEQLIILHDILRYSTITSSNDFIYRIKVSDPRITLKQFADLKDTICDQLEQEVDNGQMVKTPVYSGSGKYSDFRYSIPEQMYQDKDTVKSVVTTDS